MHESSGALYVLRIRHHNTQCSSTNFPRESPAYCAPGHAERFLLTFCGLYICIYIYGTAWTNVAQRLAHENKPREGNINCGLLEVYGVRALTTVYISIYDCIELSRIYYANGCAVSILHKDIMSISHHSLAV